MTALSSEFDVRKTNIEISQKLICCNKVKVIIITSEDVCWNIRNVKLKFYFFPAMRSPNPLAHKTKIHVFFTILIG